MRDSEFYAEGIHGFFVGFALDAIEPRDVETLPVAKPAAVVHDDYDFEPDDCTGCSCAAIAWPPCSHRENDHNETEGAS